MQFGIMIVPILAIIGGTIDIINKINARSDIQNVIDAAALAAVNGHFTVSERENIYADFVNSALAMRSDLEYQDHSVKVWEENGLLHVAGTLSVSTQSLAFFDHGLSNKISAETETVFGSKDIEIVLALDISSSMNGKRITEAKAAADSFIDLLFDKSELKGRLSVSLVPFGGTVKLPKSLSYLVSKQAHLTAPGQVKHWMEGAWNGCLEFDPSDFTNGISPARRYDTIPDFWSWWNTNPWCPRPGNEFVPLTDDPSVLKARLKTLTLSDGTGTDHGMAWARANLSDAWTNKFPGTLTGSPQKASPEVQKIVVLMTDGGVTGQHYVTPSNMIGLPPYNSKKTTRISGSAAWTSFSTLCTKMKDEDGTQIVTVAYLISNSTHLQRLADCASSESMAYKSDSGQLSKIFDSIADNISPVRISH